MTLSNGGKSHPDILDLAQTQNSQSQSSELNLVSLYFQDKKVSADTKSTSQSEPQQLAFAGELISTESGEHETKETAEQSADRKAKTLFPKDKIEPGKEDPLYEPRDLARRDILGTLSEEEYDKLRAWKRFPGLDDDSTAARNLMFKNLIARDSMTREDTAFLSSWQEFPNPDKRLSEARNLAYMDRWLAQSPDNGENGRQLNPEEQAKLEAWRSFNNPDSRYDRPRQLIENESSLTELEKAELASWIDFPGLNKHSAELRILAQKEFLNESDAKAGLTPADIAKLEAQRIFNVSGAKQEPARILAEAHIRANYKDGPPLSQAELAELTAWMKFSDPDSKFDQARKLYAKSELEGMQSLTIAEEEMLDQAYAEATTPDTDEPNKNYARSYHSPASPDKHFDERKLLPGRSPS
ncbi:MAG: hypothetical protein K2W82_07835 [Candidatus Obscuribacterales bacterium]|nr:hypothetical protein [Candidatus Obscuribacterales bacterium]